MNNKVAIEKTKMILWINPLIYTNDLLCQKLTSMSKVFRITPKRINGTVLTPGMVVTVTTQMHTTTPFYNGAKEVQEAYIRLYGFDYKKACCSVNDFEFQKLD